MPPTLWPPLSAIRAAFLDDGSAGAMPPRARHAGDAPARDEPAGVDLLLPLAELARRRQDVAARTFGARWAPGRLLCVLHDGALLGVLLDRALPGGRWAGWLASAEADWAGAHDLLLEPGDEPFEPLFGVVHAWNPVQLAPGAALCARVVGELSATRLAALRALADECAGGAPLPIAPEPGRVALRTVGDSFTVLCGTPLGGAEDPRHDYQALYREVARRLAAPLGQPAGQPDRLPAGQGQSDAPAPPRAQAVAPAGAGAGGAAGDGLWAGLRRWFGADALVRPAFALLALVVVVQNAGLLGGEAGGGGTVPAEPDTVRFRDAPPAAGAEELVLRFRPGTDVAQAAALLQSLALDVVAGPDARGGFRVRTQRAGTLDAARSALAASALVESVGPP